jgi:hypothetical protein
MAGATQTRLFRFQFLLNASCRCVSAPAPVWLHEIKHDGFRILARRQPRPLGGALAGDGRQGSMIPTSHLQLFGRGWLACSGGPTATAEVVAKSGSGSNRAELPIPPFWSEARLAIHTASEIRFVIPRQSRIALPELNPIASLCDRSRAVSGQRLAKTNPPRPTRLRRSKRRVRCNRESPWHWPMQPGRPLHKFKMLRMKKVGRDQGMKLTMLWCFHIAIPLISRNVA